MPEVGDAPLLEYDDVSVTYRKRGRPDFLALDSVSFTLRRGESLGVVGESGSGKTTLGRVPFGLVPVTGGRVTFDGEDLLAATRKERRALTARMQMVFQDPYGSLNPSKTVGETLVEPLMVHSVGADMRERRARVGDALELVGLERTAAHRYPREFSGGQRQRVAVARAIIIRPDLLVCDESVSALDLSVQAQILNLLADLRTELGLGMIFISHDLNVVRHVADRILVVYRGRIVEEGSQSDVAEHPQHPYTEALMAAVPVPDPIEQAARRAALSRRRVADGSAPGSEVGALT